MRYHVLATDYDGTIALHGKVDEPTLKALSNFRATGRHLVMVTGRELPDLMATFDHLDLFEWVVAENGGLLYKPATKEERPICEGSSDALVDLLKKKGVGPISVGKGIIATWEPHQNAVLESIRELGLELQVIFNKGAVMILPAGVNKSFGLTAALKEMKISPHNVVGVGDAENDHAFLKMCEVSAAVDNALPAVKETADIVLKRDHGAGVAELIESIIENDLSSLNGRLQRHAIVLGKHGDEETSLPAYGSNVLICGPSGSGKSTVATRVVESLIERSYQFCLIDPEGDYDTFEGAVVQGGPKSVPQLEEVLHLLEDNEANVVVCLTGMPISDRPAYFLNLLSHLIQMRTRIGRPHWFILDETHHLMPREWAPPEGVMPEQFTNMLMITVHPDILAPALLERVNIVAAVGGEPDKTLKTFAEAAKVKLPRMGSTMLEQGEVMLWMRDAKSPPKKVKAYPSKSEHRRHHRKYSEGELPPERSFYFQGPGKKLNLRAQNLMMFLQLADGVDDETWLHHLKQDDYARWFRDCIKDDNLAAAVEQIAKMTHVSPIDSRKLVRTEVERDYTLPASAPLPVPGAS